jgi:hypothetical protein
MLQSASEPLEQVLVLGDVSHDTFAQAMTNNVTDNANVRVVYKCVANLCVASALEH